MVQQGEEKRIILAGIRVTVATMSERRDAVHKWALLELGSAAQFAHRLRVNGRSQLVLLAVRLELIYADESSAEELQWSRLITSLASIRPDAAASFSTEGEIDEKVKKRFLDFSVISL